MAYHISNLGSFRHHAQPFADLTGFVPQAGDRREHFAYNGTYDPKYVGDVPWDEFVQSAVEATRDAENDAQVWRDVQASGERRASVPPVAIRPADEPLDKRDELTRS